MPMGKPKNYFKKPQARSRAKDAVVSGPSAYFLLSAGAPELQSFKAARQARLLAWKARHDPLQAPPSSYLVTY